MTGKKEQQQAELTPKQAQAITALLANPTMVMAAKQAKISLRTIQNYLNLNHFRAALAEAESLAMAEAARRLAADASIAAIVLGQIMTDKEMPPAVRVQAARTILSLATGFRLAVDFEQRLVELEQRFNEK